jgi:hypothetical protein
MEESLYDEFGNYLGPELPESEEEEEETLQPMQEDIEEEYEEGEVEVGSSNMALMEIDGTRSSVPLFAFPEGFLISSIKIKLLSEPVL